MANYYLERIINDYKHMSIFDTIELGHRLKEDIKQRVITALHKKRDTLHLIGYASNVQGYIESAEYFDGLAERVEGADEVETMLNALMHTADQEQEQDNIIDRFVGTNQDERLVAAE